MKKFTPPEQDDSSLSPWQKENLKFLKKHQYSDFDQHDKQQQSETKIDAPKRDVFAKEEQPKEDEPTVVKRYIKPTEIDDEDLIDDWDDPFGEIDDLESYTKKPDELPHKERQEEAKPEAPVDEPHLKLLPKEDNSESSKQEEPIDEPLLEEEWKDERSLWEKVKERYQSDRFLPAKVRHQLYAIIAFFAIALAITIYYMTPLSTLQKVNVTGNDTMPNQTIVKAARFKCGQRLWHQYFNRQSAQDRVDKLAGVKSVDITLDHFNQLTIHVSEYKVVGYVLVDKIKYSPVLEDGTIMTSHVNKKKPAGILYTDFKQGNFLSEVIHAYQKVPANVRQLVTQIASSPSKSNPQLVTVYMKDGNQVKIDGTKMEKLKYYPQVSSQMENKGIIDMEVGIYSYPYGNDDTTRKNKQNVADGTVVGTTSTSSSSSSTQEIVIPEN